MSLMIDITTVSSVKVAGEWIEVVPGSLDFDSYEFTYFYDDDPEMAHLGGERGVPATGFTALARKAEGATDTWIAGPIDRLQCVKYDAGHYVDSREAIEKDIEKANANRTRMSERLARGES